MLDGMRKVGYRKFFIAIVTHESRHVRLLTLFLVPLYRRQHGDEPQLGVGLVERHGDAERRRSAARVRFQPKVRAQPGRPTAARAPQEQSKYFAHSLFPRSPL